MATINGDGQSRLICGAERSTYVNVYGITFSIMLTRQVSGSADQFYSDARVRWAKAIRTGIYDSEDMICGVVGLLEQARQQDPNHIRALTLLSDLLMELGAADAALDVVSSLLALEPNNRTHMQKKYLLRQLKASSNEDNKEAVRAFVEARWTQTNDW